MTTPATTCDRGHAGCPGDVLPADYGDGWLTANARDLVRISILFGGYDRDEVLRRVAMAPSRGHANAGTVGRILYEMKHEGDAENE